MSAVAAHSGTAPYETWHPSEQRGGDPTMLDGRPVEVLAVDWDRFAVRPRPVETLVVGWERAVEPAAPRRAPVA